MKMMMMMIMVMIMTNYNKGHLGPTLQVPTLMPYSLKPSGTIKHADDDDDDDDYGDDYDEL